MKTGNRGIVENQSRTVARVSSRTIAGFAWHAMVRDLLEAGGELHGSADVPDPRLAVTILCSRHHEEVAGAMHNLNAPLVGELHRSLNEALAGSNDAARVYVNSYRALTANVLVSARRAAEHNQRLAAYLRITAAGEPQPQRWLVFIDALASGSADAPFSPFLGRYEIGDAAALDLANRLRVMVGAHPLEPPGAVPHAAMEYAADLLQRFLRRVRHHLNHPDEQNPLERLQGTFGLSKTELGRLFGVSRQAVDRWIDGGVPANRQAKVTTLLALVDLLERKLKIDRISGVARTPADAYGGQTMLDMIASDRQRELLDSVRESFAWSQAA